jgi:hypothetical protein
MCPLKSIRAYTTLLQHLPPTPGTGFYAMGMFFYALDCMRLINSAHTASVVNPRRDFTAADNGAFNADGSVDTDGNTGTYSSNGAASAATVAAKVAALAHSWPRPTLLEIQGAADAFCANKWDDVKATIDSYSRAHGELTAPSATIDPGLYNQPRTDAATIQPTPH